MSCWNNYRRRKIWQPVPRRTRQFDLLEAFQRRSSCLSFDRSLLRCGNRQSYVPETDEPAGYPADHMQLDGNSELDHPVHKVHQACSRHITAYTSREEFSAIHSVGFNPSRLGSEHVRRYASLLLAQTQCKVRDCRDRRIRKVDALVVIQTDVDLLSCVPMLFP